MLTTKTNNLAVDDIKIPDSKLAREITVYVREMESRLLFNHSSQVYYFGALAGKQRGLNCDPELLYAGAMFHDMGLMPKYSSAQERFEVDGANAARDFLKSRGITPHDIDLVWTSISENPAVDPTAELKCHRMKHLKNYLSGAI